MVCQVEPRFALGLDKILWLLLQQFDKSEVILKKEATVVSN